ncbi:response regulator [Sphingomonas sp. PB2P12]|uniref:response regulator n=1 Tax=Sphingomonas sandaracina TaxID=3096157 RepID=UPI002FC8068F
MQLDIETPQRGIGVSLVNGEPAVRRARQLLLRSEGYAVRSYPTCAAILADPQARDYPCIILDLEMETISGLDLLRQMRARGWRGKALLLDAEEASGTRVLEAERHGYKILHRTVGDRTLLMAIAGSIDRGWSGWNAGG